MERHDCSLCRIGNRTVSLGTQRAQNHYRRHCCPAFVGIALFGPARLQLQLGRMAMEPRHDCSGLVFIRSEKLSQIGTRRKAAGCQNFKISQKTAAPNWNKTEASAFTLLQQTIVDLRRSKCALVVLAFYSLLPILSYSGRWDSYFSFSLYSENAAVANIFISQEFGERLPPHLRPYIQRFPQAFDPQHQGPFTFGFQAWGYEELHVPPISELRNFRSIFRFLGAYSKEPNDLRMIIGQRSGPVIFLEGDREEFLTPK